jgi:glycosyltransferase involved in cell wall biosynthesis
MNIAVVHTFFDEAGGGERLALEMVRALRELGNGTDLYTSHVDERAWGVLTSGLEGPPRPISFGEPLLSRALRRTGRFVRLRRLYTVTHLAGIIKRVTKGYDLVIETQANVPVSWTDASYIHFPAIIDHLAAQGRAGGLRRLYDWAVEREVRGLIDATKPIMTNSTWTAKLVREAYGNPRVYVVHPPVNVNELLPLRGEREKIVLTVSRLATEKNLHLIPRIARAVPEAKFYLVGSYGPSSLEAMFTIKQEVKGVGNFHLEVDVPRKRILELMSKASVYLHPPFAEHFGIAIAEAAAAGLVPVVYRDGGGWTDIVSRIDQGLGYTSVEEATHIVRSLLNDPGRLKELSVRAREVAKGFSYERFKERVGEVIARL